MIAPFSYTAHEQPRFENLTLSNCVTSNRFNPDLCVIEAVEDGSISVSGNDGKQHAVVAKQVWLQPLVDYSSAPSADYKATRICFDRIYFSYCLYPHLLPETKTPDSRCEAPLIFPVDFLESKMTALKHLLATRTTHTPMLIRHALHQLCIEILMAAPAGNELFPDNRPRNGVVPEHHFYYFLEANYKKPLTVDEMASTMGKSTSSFKRFFAHNYEVTPIQWLIHRRLEYAYFLWYHYPYSAETLAILCGFGEVTHFIKCFIRQFGCSPRVP